ncbi:hypothetical protein BD626DRAFT_6084 [Schizophyllum amplum]|uniref:Uncharacterized protein n=1 Tax=Schizophyllum amplum TaxID=97359 RepID=A0A550CWF4_9AGAR|nr:hypothetical protein BD626DRAFT_6084 [Auriculariopsis ampla]
MKGLPSHLAHAGPRVSIRSARHARALIGPHPICQSSSGCSHPIRGLSNHLYSRRRVFHSDHTDPCQGRRQSRPPTPKTVDERLTAWPCPPWSSLSFVRSPRMLQLCRTRYTAHLSMKPHVFVEAKHQPVGFHVKLGTASPASAADLSMSGCLMRTQSLFCWSHQPLSIHNIFS